MKAQAPRRKKNEIKLTVEYVDEKDVPPETLERMERNGKLFMEQFGKFIHDMIQKSRAEKIKSEIDTNMKP